MNFEKNVPEWNAVGSEPPASLKERGFEAGYKPPAAYFNWFWNRVAACLNELQSKLRNVFSVADGGTGKSSHTAGNYLIGNGTGALGEKTPAQVLADIGAAPKNAAIPTVAATSEDGVTYHATVEGITELFNGLIITIVPNVNSASTQPKLNVNGLGDKMVRLPLSFNNAAMTTPRLDTYISKDRPLSLQYDAAYLATDGIWKVFGKQRTSAQDLYGTVPIESGGTDAATAEEARTNLGVPADADVVKHVQQSLTAEQMTQARSNIDATKSFVSTCVLTAAGWAGDDPAVQTVNVSGVTADGEHVHIVPNPVPSQYTAYSECQIRATSQGNGTLTFAAGEIPEEDITVNILIVDSGVSA